jgi:predicted transposase YdaD
VEENLVAFLAKITNEHETLQRVLNKIGSLDANLGADYLKQLNILAGLRPHVKQELDIMPIRVRVEDTPFYERAKTEGRLQGKLEGKLEGECLLILRMLQKRFGELPQKIIERLQAADCEHLERWALLLLNANSLDEIFEE